MKPLYLLDTHILLWWLSNDKLLPLKIKKVIENEENIIFVSAVSAWEIAIKRSLKKLKAPSNLEKVLSDNNFNTLDITISHALYTEKLPSIHRDPFDRLLIAQSIVEKMTFITVDQIIPRYKIKCLNL